MGNQIEVYVCVMTDKADRSWCDSMLTTEKEKADEWIADKIRESFGRGLMARISPSDLNDIDKHLAMMAIGSAIDKVHLAQERFSFIVDTVLYDPGDAHDRIQKHLLGKRMSEMLAKLMTTENAQINVETRADIILLLQEWKTIAKDYSL